MLAPQRAGSPSYSATTPLGALHEFIDESIAETPAAALLWEEIRRSSAGGKLLRPRLLTTVHRALGGGDLSAEARAAAGFELLHTAFLIHDDVIDHDWVRRGAPNLAAVFRAAALSGGRRADVAEHFGISAAIIAGDLALAGAVHLIGSSSDEPAIADRLRRIATQAVSATAAGELMDVELSSSAEPALETVLAMYEAKTGVYTFCGPLQAGAVLARADDEVVDALGRAGLALGVAYQITDDLLGLFGDPAITGKSTISDAREGKQTVLAALLHGRGAAMQHVDAGRPAEDIAAGLRDAVERSGVRAAAEDLAAARVAEARAHLRHLPAAVQEGLEGCLGELRDRAV